MASYTRRRVIQTAGAVAATATGLTRRAKASISYPVEYIRELENDAVASPDGYSYDAYEWNGTAVLEFEDNEYIEFGDEDYPPPTAAVERDRLELPVGITLPLEINLRSMQTGVSVFLIGLIGLLGGASTVFRNPAAGIMTGLCVVLLIAAGVFGIGLEIFWLGVIITALLLVVGIAARWST